VHQLREALLSVGTAAGIAAVSYAISPLALVGLTILYVHELGHYMVAYFFDADVALPFFVPLGIFVLGCTRIFSVNKHLTVPIAWAGPAAGWTAGFFLLASATVLMTPVAISLTVGALALEVFNVLFGRDGRIISDQTGAAKHGSNGVCTVF
jgi:hypothetical protein